MERRPALRVGVAVAAVAGVAGVAILLNLVLLGFTNDPGGPDPGLRPSLPPSRPALVTTQATTPSEPTVTIAPATTPAQTGTVPGAEPASPEEPASSDAEPPDD